MNDPFEAIVRQQFRATDPDAPPRVGVEVEFLCVDRATGRPAPPVARPGAAATTRVPAATVPAVTETARSLGWRCGEGPGLPSFSRPDGTVISWEPGGQIEVATPPLRSLDALGETLRDAVSDVAAALDRHGVGLLARGLDPFTPAQVPDLWLDHPRYRRMCAPYDRGGVAGRRMMRQSAAVHVNLDFGNRPLERWARANRAVPAAIAIFANSRRVEGRTGWRSERGRAWRTLDPSRTGAFGPSSDPAARYLEFARGAWAFLIGPEGVPAPRWSEIEHLADIESWRTHLSTLFPEVRPRTYLEIRSIDALAPAHATVAAAFLAGVVYGSGDPPDVDPPTRARLVAAARSGVGSAGLRAEAMAWWDVALGGLRDLGPEFASPALLSRVDGFRREFTARGRDPGDVQEEWVVPRAFEAAGRPGTVSPWP